MAISPKFFPPRKRRPSPGSFISPINIPDLKLVRSLLFLSQEISAFKPLEFILKRCSSSIIRKTKGLVILFEEIQRNQIVFLPRSAMLCFEEIYIVLQRIKTLLEDCSNGSKMWLLLQNESVSNSFHDLTVELSTLLDIFPLREFGLNQDVMELVVLIRKQCWERKSAADPADNNFRYEMLKLLDQIKKEIVPDHSQLKLMFHKLGLRDSTSCNEEMESLEEEVVVVQNIQSTTRVDVIIALIGLVRYAKCVLFSDHQDEEDASTPSTSGHSRSPHHHHHHHHHHHPQAAEAATAADMLFPVDFKCPISLDLMTDPVVVATGQTYDRNSISHWIESGHETCPKTGQHLSHSELIPNRAMKNLIYLWCREHKIPFDQNTVTSSSSKGDRISSTAGIEATRMTAFFLVNKLSVTQSTETANRIIYELRVLAKADSDNRACIAEAGAIQLLVNYLDGGSNHHHHHHHHPQLQINAVTAILNLSILEENKKRIMECNEALDGVIEVLRSGATWESKENAAATIFSLSAVHEYRKKLWRKSRVIKGLVELGKEGPTSAKRDALVAILNLAGDREAVGRLIEGGVVEMAVQAVQVLPEEAVAILATVAKRGGAVAVAAAGQCVQRMAEVLRDGPEGARESATAGLVSICRRGGVEVVAELAATPGIERIIWELMGMGTVRARRKGASLLRILRRWAAGMEEQTTTNTTTTVRLSSTNNLHTTSRATLVHN